MRFLLAAALLALAACGGGSDKPTIIDPITGKPKPDPWITVRVRNMLDTTTAVGRANWRVYAFLTGQDANKNGYAFQGVLSLSGRRGVQFERDWFCMYAGADSVGQRIYEGVAFADTTSEVAQPDAIADSAAARWFRNDKVLPQGWMALTTGASDAWLTQQYLDGHGQVPTDPIKLGFDWAGSGAISFYERTDSDTQCDVAF